MIETEKNVYRAAFREAICPPPVMTVSEWADKYRFLSSDEAAEPGPWRTSRVPYMREIMDALSPHSGIRKIVLMKSSQVGGTSATGCAKGMYMDLHPCPMMTLFPTAGLGQEWSQIVLRSLINSTERLKGKISDRERDSSSTMTFKQFPGGFVVIAGANSGIGLRNKAIKVIFQSEIDAFPIDVDGEGSPSELAENRTRTYGDRGKIFLESSPKIKGISQIEKEYNLSDQRHYNVPCPHCEHEQALRTDQLRYDYDKDLGVASHVVYECESCKKGISEHRKTEMLERGRWIPTFPGRAVRGYHINALYSPLGWLSWTEYAVKYEKGKLDEGAMKVFVNTYEGLPYEEKGDAPDWNRLYERRESYPVGKVPVGPCILTAFADVQKDRIEVEVKGWGENFESWSVDYRILQGNPSESAVWEQLDAVLDERFERIDGGPEMRIQGLGIDSGYATQEVYQWCRKHKGSRRVFATKGSATLPSSIGHPKKVDINMLGNHIKRGALLWPIGASLLKAETFRNLRKAMPKNGEAFPRGFCHFPAYDQEYFMQLTAEQQVTRIVKGYPVQEWQKTRDRNEALDCHVGNRAIAAALGIERMGPKNWRRLRAQLGVAEPAPLKIAEVQVDADAAKDPHTPAAAPVATKPAVQKRRPQRRAIMMRLR